jgi:hypothetical protein
MNRLPFISPLLLLSTGALGAACSAAPGDPAPGESVRSTQQALSACSTPPDPAKSLFVTDATALARFPFERVMNRIAATGSTTGQTGLQVYQQLFDTLNDGAHAVTSGPHCDDAPANGVPSINGFPIDCPRQEGILASSTTPFTTGDPDSFVPLGLVNRFDLAPADGTNCGEYRIVYGKISAAATFRNRALLIFEAKLPNPLPEFGLTGCLPVALFWDELTNVPDASARASLLEAFYFHGLPSFFGRFSPVVRAQNYGIGRGPDTGQIRANLFMNVVGGQQWQLREFRLTQQCDDRGAGCSLVAENTFVQNNPFGGLFGGTDDPSTALQQEFIAQVPTLAASTIPLIAMTTPASFNAGESREQDRTNDYAAQAAGNAPLVAAVNQELAAIGRTDLTAQNVFDRATTQSCAGCHQVAVKRALGGGLTWPASNGFTQINETSTPSPALTDVFLPFRAQVLTSFLDTTLGCAQQGAGEGAGDDGGAVDSGYPPGVPQTVGGAVRGAAN